MIVKEHQIEKIVRDNKKFLNILIYGPNEGLVREQIEKLTKMGVIMINSKPQIGQGGNRIAFVHPSSSGGVLIELVESP